MAPLEFVLPDVGEGIATADVVAWHVAEGERVREHQDLVEVQTDKAVVVIPCPTTGVVLRLGAAEGESVDVGALLAVLMPETENGEPTPAAAPAARPLAAPATRRLARERGVALEEVEGSGPHGRITREDVERAASSSAPAAPTPAPQGVPHRAQPDRGTPDRRPRALPEAVGEVVPLRGVRRSIAHALTKAWLEVPRIIDYREVDATALMGARARLKERALARGDEDLARAMTPTPLIVKAAVRALRDHPYANASIDLEREEITLHRHCHVGIATASPDGLVVPVVRDAGDRTLREVALEITRLSGAARERRLRPEDLAGPTFTVNNYGGLGIWLGTPIVRPPEVVNLGVGAIRDQVVAVDGQPVVRPILALAVAGDHRVLDGDTLAAFVTQVAELLEDPVLLLEDLR
jgi:pyruvate dehydrogenase E2 component (dihydrolipoamide acetyltransferase)